MIIHTAIAERREEELRKEVPEAWFASGNYTGECHARPMRVNANFWYELHSETPGVIYLPLRGADKASTDVRNKQLASV